MTMLDGAPDCGVRRAAVAGGKGGGLAGGAPQDGAPQGEARGQGSVVREGVFMFSTRFYFKLTKSLVRIKNPTSRA